MSAPAAAAKGEKKGFKWEPVAAMVALLLLGAWVAFAPDVPQKPQEGAVRVKLTIGQAKGALEWLPTQPEDQRQYLLHFRDGTTQGPKTGAQVREFLGERAYVQVTGTASNALFRLLNVTSWLGVAWVAAGFAGQLAFSGRWLLQWFVSEKSKSSTVPVAFWWLSLVGSVILFAYFAWRQDLVGTLGQTSGVVIYARNIRLIHKQARRAARELPPSATS